MRLYTTVAIGPIPPEVEKISGEKEPCSTSLILSGTLLFLLVSSVALNQSGATMTPCIWIKNPDIKECILSIMSPEILCYNIETSTILSIGCLVPEMFVL